MEGNCYNSFGERTRQLNAQEIVAQFDRSFKESARKAIDHFAKQIWEQRKAPYQARVLKGKKKTPKSRRRF